MTTVLDFQHEVLTTFSTNDPTVFTRISNDCCNFWVKLLELGQQNIKKYPPDTVPNIDATVQLDDSQLAALREEFQSLLK